MSDIKQILMNPWDLINEIADEKTKEEFELDNILVDISSKLINYRIKNSITQKKLADKLEISQAMVSKLESGDYNPTIGQLWKISKKLDWKFEVVFEENTKHEVSYCVNTSILSNEITDDERILEQLGESA